MTDNLGHRIEELESHTVRMTRLSSFKSTTSLSTNSSTCGRRGRKHRSTTGEGSVFRSRWVQGAILALVSIMTLCLVAMATLYILQVLIQTFLLHLNKLTSFSTCKKRRKTSHSCRLATSPCLPARHHHHEHLWAQQDDRAQ